MESNSICKITNKIVFFYTLGIKIRIKLQMESNSICKITNKIVFFYTLGIKIRIKLQMESNSICKITNDHHPQKEEYIPYALWFQMQ